MGDTRERYPASSVDHTSHGVHLPPAESGHCHPLTDRSSRLIADNLGGTVWCSPPRWDEAGTVEPQRVVPSRARGFRVPPVGFHDLRQSQVFAAESGATLPELVARLGHASPPR